MANSFNIFYIMKTNNTLNKTFILSLGLLCLICVSCSKKAQPTSITGRVYTRNTDIGHEGLRVWLEVNDGGAGALGGGGSGYNGLVAETTTDEFGYYSLNHKCYPDRSYYLHLEGSIPKHWSGNWSARQVWPGNSQDLSYEIAPYGYYKIRLVNTHPPITIEDFAWFTTVTFGLPSSKGFEGRFIDETILVRGVGNTENIIYLGSDKSGVKTTFFDTIYVSMDDTAYYEFIY